MIAIEFLLSNSTKFPFYLYKKKLHILSSKLYKIVVQYPEYYPREFHETSKSNSEFEIR